MRLTTHQEIKVYYEGKRHGIREYAWWKDGLQYVGTTGRTLMQALSGLNLMEQEKHQILQEGREVEVAHL